MRFLLISCLAVALAAGAPALAATKTPASATVTIVIPAFPAASVAAAIKKAGKAMGKMPNIEIMKSRSNESPEAPPGVLKFAPGEVNRVTSAQIGKVVSIYPATLPEGHKGHLIVVNVTRRSNPFMSVSRAGVVSVVQPDSNVFKLHAGERIVLVRSTMNGWARVLPYNGPKLSNQNQ